MPRFVDTNIVLYSISTDPAEDDRRGRAQTLFDAADLALSTQVLGEFYVQATRATRRDPLTHAQAAGIIRSLKRYPIQPVTVRIVDAALATADRYQISYWDAAIIEAARTAGCAEVLSEDLSNGQEFGGVVVANPLID